MLDRRVQRACDSIVGQTRNEYLVSILTFDVFQQRRRVARVTQRAAKIWRRNVNARSG
jgi:hypothetical protein